MAQLMSRNRTGRTIDRMPTTARLTIRRKAPEVVDENVRRRSTRTYAVKSMQFAIRYCPIAGLLDFLEDLGLLQE